MRISKFTETQIITILKQGDVARANGRDLQVIDLQGRINSNAPDFCMAQCRKHGYRSTQCSELGA